jgi:alkylation response protein AidB-like acyl-CoA dehydrogenase
VDFELSADQAALQEGVRNLLEGRFPMTVVRAIGDAGRLDRGRWAELAELGVFALRLPEAEGGVELGWADAVLVFEELGRALVPGPMVWTHLAAGTVDGAASGTVVVGGLERNDPSGLVEHAADVDVLLVVDDDGVWSVDPSALALEPIANPLDPLTPVSRLSDPLPQGERLLGAGEVDAFRRRGRALVAGQLLGVAAASTELAVAYAKERVQFDRPIGAFQAIKHILADMFTRTEVARGAVYAAGVTLDDPAVGDVDRAVVAAKLTADEAAVGNGKAGVQVHGGMGYTWEVDAHLLLKRAYVLEPLFGSVDACADAMAGFLARA